MSDPLVGSSPALEALIAKWRERAEAERDEMNEATDLETQSLAGAAWANVATCANELEKLVRELVPVPPQPQTVIFERNSMGEPIAWILIETWRDDSEHHEGIALTHEAKDAFMRGAYEVGQSRSALPLKIHGGVAAPAPSAPPAYTIEIEQEDDGRYFASWTTGDGKEGGTAEYATTVVGALALLGRALLEVQEDKR